MAISACPARLHDIALSLLELAREEAREAYRARDDERIRDAAERAWLAATQAVDGAMHIRGRVPGPGPMAPRDRHEFLKRAGRSDLSEELSVFAERLHGQVYFDGAVPREGELREDLDRVQAFIAAVNTVH